MKVVRTLVPALALAWAPALLPAAPAPAPERLKAEELDKQLKAAPAAMAKEIAAAKAKIPAAAKARIDVTDDKEVAKLVALVGAGVRGEKAKERDQLWIRWTFLKRKIEDSRDLDDELRAEGYKEAVRVLGGWLKKEEPKLGKVDQLRMMRAKHDREMAILEEQRRVLASLPLVNEEDYKEKKVPLEAAPSRIEGTTKPAPGTEKEAALLFRWKQLEKAAKEAEKKTKTVDKVNVLRKVLERGLEIAPGEDG